MRVNKEIHIKCLKPFSKGSNMLVGSMSSNFGVCVWGWGKKNGLVGGIAS